MWFRSWPTQRARKYMCVRRYQVGRNNKKCMECSGNDKVFVQYRTSILTRVLQTALSGNARISVICTINPTWKCKTESTMTLRFAQRAKMIRTAAKMTRVSVYYKWDDVHDRLIWFNVDQWTFRASKVSQHHCWITDSYAGEDRGKGETAHCYCDTTGWLILVIFLL